MLPKYLLQPDTFARVFSLKAQHPVSIMGILYVTNRTSFASASAAAGNGLALAVQSAEAARSNQSEAAA